MLTVKGLRGAVYVGSRLAATLGAWTLTDQIVTATVLSSDGLYGPREATSLRLTLAKSEWRWPLTGVIAQGGTYPVSGPPEER